MQIEEGIQLVLKRFKNVSIIASVTASRASDFKGNKIIVRAWNEAWETPKEFDGRTLEEAVNSLLGRTPNTAHEVAMALQQVEQMGGGK